MKTASKFILLGLASWLILAVVLAPAFAAADPPKITPGYSACGAPAEGMDPWDRKIIKGAFPRRFVAPSGIWGTCQPWVPDGGDPALPEPVQPPPDCAARDTYEVWEVKGVMCTSIPPGASTSTTMMLRQTPLGRVRLIASDKSWTAMGKATYGHAVFRCVAATDGSSRWHLEGADCRWAND